MYIGAIYTVTFVFVLALFGIWIADTYRIIYILSPSIKLYDHMHSKSRKRSLTQRHLVYGLFGVAVLLAGFLLLANNATSALFSGSPHQTALTAISWNLSSWISAIVNITNNSAMKSHDIAPPGKDFIRIRPLQVFSGGNATWVLPNYYAENVISLLTYVKPDVLERYTSGPLNANMLVPTAPGDPTMNVAQFLNASELACNCYIIHRVSAVIGVANVVIEANSLYNFPIKTKMRYLSIDDWGAFLKNNSAANVTVMFTELYAQGWKGIGINGCGNNIQNASVYPSFVDVCVTTNNWQPNQQQLKVAHSESNIKKVILYIDFPSQMQKFSELNTDQEASVLTSLAALQSIDKYKLDYNMLQVITFNTIQNGTMWDTSQRFTSANSIWHNESLTDVMKNLQSQYNLP